MANAKHIGAATALRKKALWHYPERRGGLRQADGRHVFLATGTVVCGSCERT